MTLISSIPTSPFRPSMPQASVAFSGNYIFDDPGAESHDHFEPVKNPYFYLKDGRPVTEDILLQLIQAALKNRRFEDKLLSLAVWPHEIIPYEEMRIGTYLTFKDALQDMEDHGLIYRPPSSLGGYKLTKAGKRRLRELRQS